MSLMVETPPGHTGERAYVLGVLLGDFLGLEWQHRTVDRPNTRLVLPGTVGELLLPDTFFGEAGKEGIFNAMPHRPLPVWDVRESGLEPPILSPLLPVVHGDATLQSTIERQRICLPIDVLGSAFFVLTRYEELVLDKCDEHGRFPASASLAYGDGFLERPIVDEYVELLWAAMQRLWPGLVRRRHAYTVVLSHDIDHPFGAKKRTVAQLIRSLGGDFVRRQDGWLALRRLAAKMMPGSVGYRLDPNNSFNCLMDEAESRGIKSSFNFMVGRTSNFDPGYDINAPVMTQLIRRIHHRGHEIGLHPSYGTLGRPDLLKAEADTLRETMVKARIDQPAVGGRQHYLRWSAGDSWQHWDDAGLAYDSTLGYAQHAGFRSGTCHEYSTWSFRDRRTLSLKERPLVIMDSTLFGPTYMNLDVNAALATVEKLADACRLLKGKMTFLWHNDSHLRFASRDFFTRALDLLAG